MPNQNKKSKSRLTTSLITAAAILTGGLAYFSLTNPKEKATEEFRNKNKSSLVREVDKDRDGIITPEEMAQTYREKHPRNADQNKIYPVDIHSYIKTRMAVDKDGDGDLSSEEWERAYEKYDITPPSKNIEDYFPD